MKQFLLAIFFLTTLAGYSQEREKFSSSTDIPQDSSQIKSSENTLDKQKQSTVSELFIIGKKSLDRSNKNPLSAYSPFKGHWSGFNYGFINFADVPDAWQEMELDYSHSFAMQFNLAKYSINFVPRNNFGLVTGIGLEYQRFRFNHNNISLAKRDGALEIIYPMQENPEISSIKRSTFKTLYLTIPLLLEVQFPTHCSKRMYISGGVMGGIRMHSKTKIVYTNGNGHKNKIKNKGDFNMLPFKADVMAKIGYRSLNIWGSYTLTNMFKADKSPELHPYTVGLGISF